jgi:hypothetical protein
MVSVPPCPRGRGSAEWRWARRDVRQRLGRFCPTPCGSHLQARTRRRIVTLPPSIFQLKAIAAFPACKSTVHGTVRLRVMGCLCGDVRSRSVYLRQLPTCCIGQVGRLGPYPDSCSVTTPPLGERVCVPPRLVGAKSALALPASNWQARWLSSPAPHFQGIFRSIDPDQTRIMLIEAASRVVVEQI